ASDRGPHRPGDADHGQQNCNGPSYPPSGHRTPRTLRHTCPKRAGLSHMPVVWQASAAGTTLPPVGGEGRLTSRSEVNRGGGPTLAQNLPYYPPPRSLRSRPSPPLGGGRVESAARPEPTARSH